MSEESGAPWLTLTVPKKIRWKVLVPGGALDEYRSHYLPGITPLPDPGDLIVLPLLRTDSDDDDFVEVTSRRIDYVAAEIVIECELRA